MSNGRGGGNSSFVTSLFIILKYLVCLGLPGYLRLFDFSHPLDIFGKIAEERRIKGCIVYRYNALDQLRRTECQCHGSLCSPSPTCQYWRLTSFDMSDLHGMANQCGFLQPMLINKSCDIVCHRDVVMVRVMGGVTMIA